MTGTFEDLLIVAFVIGIAPALIGGSIAAIMALREG